MSNKVSSEHPALSQATASAKHLRDSSKSTTNTSKSNARQTLDFLTSLAKSQGYCGLRSTSELVDYSTLRIGPVVGKGAYAVVALCERWDCNNQAYACHAVKQLKPAVANDKVELKFFLLEAHIISQLHHRNIIRYEGFGLRKIKEIRTAFYLMEHLPGGSLKGQFQKDHSKDAARAVFSSVDAMRWSVELCSAIAYMHGLTSPIIHRDIKLENILLTSSVQQDASVKLADFGLAVQMAHRPKYSREEALEKLTALRTDASGPIAETGNESWYHLTGQSGSLLYMAPEVFLNLPYNEKADVFSLGVVLYELFTGRMIADVVLEERTWAEAKEFARRVSQGHRIKLHTLPREIAKLIKNCWQQDPTQRPAAYFVLQRLLELQEQQNESHLVHSSGVTPSRPRYAIGDTQNNRSWVQRSITKVARALHRRLSI